MNYRLESIIIYIIFAIVFSFAMWIYIYFCRKYNDKQRIYRWFAVIPYAEMILSLILLCILYLNGFENNALFLVTLGLILLPFIHLFMYYYVPYGNEKVPHFKRIQCLITLFCYVFLALGLLYCFYSGVFLFGFRNKQPISIEVIRYDWSVILHFEDEDIRLDTQGEGLQDSIYFRNYLKTNNLQDYIEIWLDNSKLMDVLHSYE